MNMHSTDALRAPFSADEIAAARRHATGRGLSITAALDELSALPPEAFLLRLAASFHYGCASIDDLHQWQPAFDVLPFADALRKQLLLFRDDSGAFRLVFGDPFAADRLAWADESIDAPFIWTLAHHADVAAYLSRHEETLSAVEGLLPSAVAETIATIGVEDLSFRSITEDASQVVKLVRSTLYDALKAEASDIHLETSAQGLGIKYRVDGVLVAIGNLPGVELAEQVISRVKVMAELDISERRIPQDGRFKVSVRGREIDFRVSIMPSIFGEDGVLRILDKQQLADEVKGLTLESIGFDVPTRSIVRKLAAEPYGMLLITGPTGSGKTTTLYAAISEINHGRDKIITIEDPVEYQLPGVLQIPVNEKKGLTFARGLRSILRHDPDRVMVGEIRDTETAQIAIQAALTGHLVFTTVHANNVFDVLGRFTHMGIDTYSFSAALNGVVAQRLVRLNCPHCSTAVTPSEADLTASGLTEAMVKDFRFMGGRGCGQCRGTGYKGRTAIAEIMVLTDELREMIVARAPIRALKDAAKRSGTRFLREAAVSLVAEGRTNLEEINRVTFVA
ncbi:MAG TPA: GspE/PulE family protein [Burkholderiales bacterium]|nr:GspE/PulE family protein [Burkholderiales bacterium]